VMPSAERLAVKVAGLRVGPGTATGIEKGPLINPEAVARVEAHIADALGKGARLLVGGTRHALGWIFFQPTVLADVTPDMRVTRKETFGPVAPLFRRELDRAWRVSEALEYGMIGINSRIISTVVALFGGVKQSGLEREGFRYGID